MYRNHVTLIGYLARDPESRQTADKVPYAVLTLVTKISWRDRNGEWKTRSEYHRCIAWGARFAGIMGLKRGSHLQIEGELRCREFVKDGVTQTVAEIHAGSVLHLRKAWVQTESTIEDTQSPDSQR